MKSQLNARHTRDRLRRLGVAGVALFAVVVTASACSSSGPKTSSDTSGSGGSTGAGSADLGTINVITSVPTGIPAFPLNHGSDLDAWKGTGLKVNLIQGSAGTVAQAMAAGKADLSYGSSVTFATAISQGLKAKLVAAESLPWGQDLVVSKQSGITSADQLKGKTFGVSSFASSSYFSVLKLAESMGWSKSDYKVTQLSTIDTLSAALKSGTIQAFAWNSLNIAQMVNQGFAVDLGQVEKYVGPIVGTVFAANDSILKDRPAAVKAFFTGYFKLVKSLQADPTPVQNILVNKEKADPKAVAQVLTKQVGYWSPTGDMPEANRLGLQKAVPTLSKDIKSVDIDAMTEMWTTL